MWEYTVEQQRWIEDQVQCKVTELYEASSEDCEELMPGGDYWPEFRMVNMMIDEWLAAGKKLLTAENGKFADRDDIIERSYVEGRNVWKLVAHRKNEEGAK